MEEDLNKLSGKIIEHLDRINRILSYGRLESKLLSNPDIPDRLLKLSQQEWAPRSDIRSTDSSNRLSVDDLDSLFNKIRHRPAGGSTRLNRANSQKKAIPLQQSRILNETNLASSPSGSMTDLSDSGRAGGKSFDVEALVKSLKQSVQALSLIENRTIKPIDFDRVERYNRREFAKVKDTVRDVETMVQDLEKYVTSVRPGDQERTELVNEELVMMLRDLSEVMSHESI